MIIKFKDGELPLRSVKLGMLLGLEQFSDKESSKLQYMFVVGILEQDDVFYFELKCGVDSLSIERSSDQLYVNI